MATKNMGYDHPAYLSRLSHAFGQNAAGASTAFGKFVAFTALTVFGINANLLTAGTSTYTAWNGTATTTAINGDQFSLIRVTNTAAAGATPALSTSTYGPYALSLYNGTATATQTALAGVSNYVTPSQTGVGSNTAAGGFTVNQGDTLHIVRGTDATAVAAYSIEYGVTPLANVTA
ncbi:MAG: hypothetical protein JWR07_1914 [Nevskia sp.]|nr:hypothetical protein [Nevskia sp.]